LAWCDPFCSSNSFSWQAAQSKGETMTAMVWPLCSKASASVGWAPWQSAQPTSDWKWLELVHCSTMPGVCRSWQDMHIS
jgi:hypothetical protein